MCFHGGECSDCGILAYDTVQAGRGRNIDDVLITRRHDAGGDYDARSSARSMLGSTGVGSNCHCALLGKLVGRLVPARTALCMRSVITPGWSSGLR
jgi:hypothetical protein